MKQLQHFSHEEHPLILKKPHGQFKAICNGCEEQISTSSGPIYQCNLCQFYLHKSCGESPREINHPMHPQHPLTLRDKPVYAGGSYTCSGCSKSLSCFTYNCSSCEFDLDIPCAFLDRTKKFKHECHDHDLIFNPRMSSFLCDGCVEFTTDQSYQCNICIFQIHKVCASLPKSIQHADHSHRLSVAYCVPEEFRGPEYNCSVCNTKLHASYWVFICRSCRYFVHLKCLRLDGELLADEEGCIQEIGSSHGSNNLLKHQQIQSLESLVNELEKEFSTIIGLEDLKVQLRTWAKGLMMDLNRQKLGINVGARKPPHMAFLGNPGTGKTTIARVLGKLLLKVGVLKSNKVVEVQRTDLVAEYIGQTGPKTKAKIDEAKGGILFVDEAYRLALPSAAGSSMDFGIEALEEIMSIMESGQLSIIFAGYKDPMQRLLASNEGFRRRVNTIFVFDNYSPEELAKILHVEFKKEKSRFYGFKLDPSCTIDVVARLIKRETTEEQRNKMNAGLVEQMLTKARENLDTRLQVNCLDKNMLVTITFKDLEVSLQLLNKNQEIGFMR